MAGHSWKLLLLLSVVSCLPHSYVAQDNTIELDTNTDTNETSIDLSNGNPGDIGEPELPDTPDSKTPEHTTFPPENGENLFAEVTTVVESVSTSTAAVTTTITTTSPPPPPTTVSEEISESTSPPTTTPPSENPPSPPTTPPPSQRPSDNSNHGDTSE